MEGKMEGKRITIKEISKLANVSPTTVTKALTGKSKVSEEKRADIIKIARELGYKPNKYARALVKNDITIGVVVPEEPHEFLKYLLKGLKYGINELSDLKVKGVFEYFHDNNATEQTIVALNSILDRNINGLIFAPGFGNAAYLPLVREIIEEKKIPVVFIGQTVGSLRGIACVKSNADVIGRMAAEYLGLSLPQGSDIAVITTNKEYELHKDVLNGFCSEAKEYGLKIRAVLENHDRSELAYMQTGKIIKMFPDVRGIYVTSYNSIPVCTCIHDSGLADKITVIGHDLYPELVPYIEKGSLKASIYQNPFLYGRTAVKVIYEYMTEKKDYPGDILIKPELILKSNLVCYKHEL
jgi:LacI family transcriptional regulator